MYMNASPYCYANYPTRLAGLGDRHPFGWLAFVGGQAHLDAARKVVFHSIHFHHFIILD
jgi:hypothetical protein